MINSPPNEESLAADQQMAASSNEINNGRPSLKMPNPGEDEVTFMVTICDYIIEQDDKFVSMMDEKSVMGNL
jgi:hypothetical protein